jgi:AcrR family transcriptional regulator
MGQRAPRPQPYHHGDLRAALLGAAEAILERDGIQALTLRAAARAAGVSHAAPAHHFGDLTGLLSELAATGYARFRDALLAGMDAAGPAPAARLHAMGQGYVRFARDHPNLFLLMFRGERLDAGRPALRDAMNAAYGALAEAAAAARPATAASGDAPAPDRLADATAAWAIAHGLAMLLIDGRLRGVADDTDALVSAALSRLAL